jgi:hypothetical protein
LLGFTDELTDFFFVNQQLSGAQRGMIGGVAVVIGSDVAVEEPELSVFDEAIGVFQVGGTGTNRLDLGSREYDSRFEFF